MTSSSFSPFGCNLKTENEITSPAKQFVLTKLEISFVVSGDSIISCKREHLTCKLLEYKIHSRINVALDCLFCCSLFLQRHQIRFSSFHIPWNFCHFYHFSLVLCIFVHVYVACKSAHLIISALFEHYNDDVSAGGAKLHSPIFCSVFFFFASHIFSHFTNFFLAFFHLRAYVFVFVSS